MPTDIAPSFKIKTTLHISDGEGRSWKIIGCPRELAALPVGDATHRAVDAEQYLSRLLGLTVKIETEAV